MSRPKKVAIIHDWLTGMRGGEKCLEVFCRIFPEATLFTLIHEKGKLSETIEKMDIKTSYLQKVPFITGKYRNFLPFFPSAVEKFDFSGYDLILSSSHCVAKGAIKPAGALHICYCYTPVRYAWSFFDEYFARENPLKRFIIKRTMEKLKKWDIRSNKRVDYFIAISHNIKNRIRTYYNRESDVIYPPVDTEKFGVARKGAGYYLVVSALVPYKRIDLAVKAFSKTGRRLIVVGDGSEKKRLESTAKDNIEFIGWAGDDRLKELYADCEALIFPGEEDFGIVPLEAQACGKPVIAYGKGGALETIVPLDNNNPVPGATGVFFMDQTAGALDEAVEVFEKNRGMFVPEKIRDNAEKFGLDRFRKEVESYISGKWEEHNRP